MRRAVIGGVAGVAVWLGAALAAEAQIDIKGTKPLSVVYSQTSSTYEAVVTCNYNFSVNLKVYLNGVMKHQSVTCCFNSGPTYNFSKVVNMTGWGMKAGDTLLYRARAYYSNYSDVDDLTVIVSGSTTRLVPNPLRRLAVDRDREEWV
jgi:hypothetical protein